MFISPERAMQSDKEKLNEAGQSKGGQCCATQLLPNEI